MNFGKPKYQENAELCYMDTDSFIIHIKTDDVHGDIANDIEEIFDKSNYEVNKPLPTGNNKKVIGLMKDELGGKITVEFVALIPKTYSSLIDDDINSKRAKEVKKCVTAKLIKHILYVDCSFSSKSVLQSQQIFKNEAHNVYTKEINIIVLRSNDDKRLQTFDNITSYPYGTSIGKVCKTELLNKYR